MKKNFLFAMAMAAVFAGCSSDDDPVANAGGEVTGEGYIALSINLPTQNTTRAFNENSDLNDGMPSEYAVKNAKALIFDGSTQSYKGQLELSTHPWTNNSDKHITTTSSVVVKETGGIVAAGDDVLIVLNTPSSFPTFGGSDTYVTVSQKILEVSGVSDDGYILMTNAPLVNKTPSSSTFDGEISVLVDIPTVYSTAEAAQAAAPKPQIYVERAVAKVTMQQPATDQKLAGVANDDNITWQIDGWLLNNTNSKSYLVRQTTTSDIQDWGALMSTSPTAQINGYRFVGNTQIGTSGKYRTYFAKDVNYDNTAEALTQVDPSTAALSNLYGDENPQYCYENTFDVANQINKQTTHVIIKAILNGGVDLYIVDGSKINVYKENSLVAYLLSEMGISEATLKTFITGSSTITDADFEMTMTPVAGEESVYNITSIAPKPTLSTSGSEYTSTGFNDLKTLITNNISKVNTKKITKYANGVSYYAARIKHFGNDFTPWNVDEDPLPTTGEVYPSVHKDENYLGRYGVLRNNWYDLNVTSIATVGEVSIKAVNNEENDDDPDDELESYITLQINILSWAKRTQNVEL